MPRLLTLPFDNSPIGQAVAIYLLAAAETPKGLRQLKRAAKLAEQAATRSKVADLRGSRPSAQALQSMDTAAVFLAYLSQVAVEQRTLAKFG